VPTRREGVRHLEALSQKIADIVCSEVSAGAEDREIYEFASKLLVNCTFDILVIFCLAYAAGVLLPVAVAYALVAVFKYFAGGAHAQKMLNCLLIGICVYLGIGLGARALAVSAQHLVWIAYVVCSLLALASFALYAPSAHPNKPLRTKQHRQRLKRCAMSALIAVLVLKLVWLVRPFAPDVVFWSGCLALVWQSLILLPESQRLFDNSERYMFK